MIIAEVVGQVVCTQKDKTLVGKKMLVVQPLKAEDMKPSGARFVALDAIGSGVGEVVLVVGGSSARMADDYSKVCVDQSIVGTIDTVEIEGTTVFNKGA